VGVAVLLSRGPREVAWIDGGLGRITKYSDGQVTGVDAYPPRWREKIVSAIRREKLDYPSEKLSFADETRTIDAPSMYVAPVNTVVRDERPTFTWRERTPEAKYRVLVYSDYAFENESREIDKSNVLDSTVWRPDVALRRGRVYSWEVVVMVGEKEFVSDEPRPRFRILSKIELQQVEQAEREATESPLTRSLIYLDAGLIDEARGELMRLHESNSRSPLLKRFLDSLGRIPDSTSKDVFSKG
jgi:hypothetical protein